MKEESIVRQIEKYLRSLGECEWEKRHGSVFGKRGQPDLSGCLRGRRFEFEVKVPGKKADPLQAARLRSWARAGAITGTVRCVEDVSALLEGAVQ